MARSPRAARSLPLPPGLPPADPKAYRHKQESAARPEVGAAPRFRARKEVVTYRYDSSLSPALEWDSHPAREVAAWLLNCIEEAAVMPGQTFPEPRLLRGADGKPLASVAGLQDALNLLKGMQKPFLNWSGKAERLSFDVPTLPLFIHERLSTEAIMKTLQGHRKTTSQSDLFELFADPQMPMSRQVDAYSHRNSWVNRMILGDSLSVMNSLVSYEGLGGQVQMIFMDPPYGVKFGSNFQPFVRERDVKHGDDEDMTREPEMVQAYRDTWQLGLHSYLTYIRDRLLIARDLLKPCGSIFVQISDDNLHHVREVLDEVFGAENHVAIIPFRKKTMPLGAKHLESICDYILFYARDISRLKYRPIYGRMSVEGDSHWNYVELADGTRRKMTKEEIDSHALLPPGATPFQLVSLYPAGVNSGGLFEFEFRGKRYRPPAGNSWFTNPEGMEKLKQANRIEPYSDGDTLRYVLKLTDAPYSVLTNMWSDTSAPSDKMYVVQTSTKVIQRCMLMTTDPGDLVLDPTCGGGTTAYVAENWGRRWVTIDTSRVPIVLARQRLLTATFPWFKLRDANSGPAGGFVYNRKQNRKGEEVGGISPYVTKGSIANGDPVSEIVLVDRPDVSNDITRVTGPFVVEAVLPTPQPMEAAAEAPEDAPSDHIARMIEVLRRSPTLRLPGSGSIILKNIRRPAKSLNLSAEAMVDYEAMGGAIPNVSEKAHDDDTGRSPSSIQPVAILFGPPNGAVIAKAVLDAAKEANVKGYSHLYVIGFGFTAEARAEIMGGEDVLGLPASPVEMTHDVLMTDLLKTQRSSQIFAITGSPEIEIKRLSEDAEDGAPRWQVRLLGLDTFDPASIKPHHLNGDNVPMWMLDIGWNGRAFSADQVFFPRTKAWDSLRKALKATHENSVWQHLAGDLSAPFEAQEGTEIAVKVLDDRGNELLKTARLGA
jgi:adenine-specific DNA-methyltransferase